MLARFFTHKAAPSAMLVLAALLAMIMENSSLQGLYESLKEIPIVLQVGNFIIDKPLLLWINDGLMAVFFLLVGLEIKREMVEGYLSKREQVGLPFIAALGGLCVPALIYTYINGHDPLLLKGWAIPAATDIAFALGVLMLLGSYIPRALKVTLVAIAIIDDIAAIIIIALFYTAETSLFSLGLASFGLFLVFLLNRRGVTSLGPYIVLGFFIWACVLKSGVHATLAGVALGLLVPLHPRPHQRSPSKAMEKGLHSWVAFGVLPLFAFVNAGIDLSGLSMESTFNPIVLGSAVGLFIGKQIGVMVATGIGCVLGLCALPRGVSWMQYYGMAILTGIGFTMSLFIGTLAFTEMNHIFSVRLGVLSGSFLSAIVGCLVLLAAGNKKAKKKKHGKFLSKWFRSKN